MTPFEAIGSALRNCVNFSGRATRMEFWTWSITTFVLYATAVISDEMLNPGTQLGYMSAVVAVMTFTLWLPGLAVSIRRLHDVGKSGWWVLLALSVVGLVPLMLWNCQPGTQGRNEFGMDPTTERETASRNGLPSLDMAARA